MNLGDLLLGIAAVITSIATLITSLRVHREVKTPNGKTLGQMISEAEPHHSNEKRAVWSPQQRERETGHN